MVRDLEFEDRPQLDGSDLQVAWKEEFHSVDDTGVLVYRSPTDTITIPFEHIVQWSPLEDDPTSNLPHMWIVKPESIASMLR